MKVLRVAWLLLMMALCVGCGPSQPSPEQGTKAVSEQAAQRSNGLIKLVDFRKTDGQTFEAMGVKGYRMEYQATLRFEENCFWSGSTPVGSVFDAVRGEPKGMDRFHPLYFGKKPVKKGDQIQVSGMLTFALSESGWRIQEAPGGPGTKAVLIAQTSPP